MKSKTGLLALGIPGFALLCYLCTLWHGPRVAKALMPAVPSPELSVQMREGKVLLGGVVPDDGTRARVIASAREEFGEGNVVDGIRTVQNMGNAAWLSHTPRLLALLGGNVDGAELFLRHDTLTLRGSVSDENAKRQLLANAVASAPGLVLVDDIDVESPDVQANINTYLDGKTILFGTGSAVLLPGSKRLLDTVAILLGRAPAASVEVAGHTDNTGREQVNIRLSKERAAATRAYLVSKGIEPARLHAAGYGSQDPVASNATPEGRERNRRIQFVVKKDFGAVQK